MPVAFEHLWKIVAPVGIVEGFDLSPFDDVCQVAVPHLLLSTFVLRRPTRKPIETWNRNLFGNIGPSLQEARLRASDSNCASALPITHRVK